MGFVSIFVDDEKTTIRVSRGTPSWVRTHDRPTVKYSPILADRRARGRMIYYLENNLRDGGHGGRGPAREMLRNQLAITDIRTIAEGCDEPLSSAGVVKQLKKAVINQ